MLLAHRAGLQVNDSNFERCTVVSTSAVGSFCGFGTFSTSKPDRPPRNVDYSVILARVLGMFGDGSADVSGPRPGYQGFELVSRIRS